MEVSEPQKMSECLLRILLSKELPVLGLHPISTDIVFYKFLLQRYGFIFVRQIPYKGDKYIISHTKAAMAKLKPGFPHTTYNGLSRLPVPIQKLIKKANIQTKNAYAPYSNFYVGAALLLDNKKIIVGCNQENASYPLCMCAERVALYTYGASHTKHKIKAIAISANYPTKPLSAPCMPCGACRQVIQEYESRQGKPIDIYVTAVGLKTIIKIKGIETILPAAFQQDQLI